MPNVLDANGLQLATRDEWLAFFTQQFQDIYGVDINLSQDTPDGQWINIITQTILDIQDLTAQVYNSFSPDNAIGRVLDQRVSINGIQRQAGTYTITPITLVNSQSVNLFGLDQDEEDLYIVSDNAGTRWVLEVSQIGLAAGSHVLSFRAEDPGETLTIPNTINIPVTIVLGVESVNNPTTYTTLGINEESDAQLRLRRQRSVSLASQGYYAGLLAALLNINGVTSAFIYENTTSVTDTDGVPGHSIWVIVAGTADPADIAQAIYTKRNAGCGMHGTVTYTVTQPDGSPFEIKWDVVITRNLFIKFTATSIDGINSVNIEAMRVGIATDFIPGVYEEININTVATIARVYDPNALITNVGLSDGSEQTLTLSGIPASGEFKITYNGETSAAIDWNDSNGDINTIVQAVPGLENCTVTGTALLQELVFDLSSVATIYSLIAVVDNTLQTSAPAAITFSYDANYTDTLEPASKQNQFLVSYDNTIIVPMKLTPATTQVVSTQTRLFTGYGGYGTYVFSIAVNNSGGSINAASGLYTAGAVTSVVDTIRVTDAFGNTATASVQVV